jgi:hypothetical protein
MLLSVTKRGVWEQKQKQKFEIEMHHKCGGKIVEI